MCEGRPNKVARKRRDLIGRPKHKVAGHIPARILDVPNWDVGNFFKKKLSAPQSWCKSNYEKIKIF
jgi:hypothetical protein